MENSLEGKVAVITGASSGIGKASARAFAGLNIRMILNARRGKEIMELSEETGGIPVTGDITELDMSGKLLDTALSNFGKCDIIINNAGIIEVGEIGKIDIEKVAAMVRINVEASFRIIYTFLKYFKSVDSGYLINISSVMGTKVRPTNGAYAGTKYAVEALSESLRMELAGTNVKISCIEPGLVMTGLHKDWEVHPSVSMNIQHPLQPEDIAGQIVYLLNQPEHVRIPRLMILPSDHII